LHEHVAEKLDISEITVMEHRGQVMRTMKPGSLAGLVTMTGDFVSLPRRIVYRNSSETIELC